MLQKLKQFLKHTFIYSLSNIAAKASGFVLIPLYTAYISIDEFGQWGLIDASVMIMVEVLALGLANAILIINNAEEFKKKSASGFFTITTFVIFVNSVILILFELFGKEITASFISIEFYALLRLAVWVIVIRVINNLFLAKLRADELSVSYTIFNVIKLSVTLLLAIYFVASLQLGVEGILYAYLSAEVITLFLMIPVMLRQFNFIFDKVLLKAALNFGVPLVFSGIGIMLINLSDRYILKVLMNNETVGLYDLGYRFAGVINMFLILPFGFTLMPAAYKIYGKDGDKRYYTKLMTYFTFILVWAGLALSIFSKEIIETLTFNPDYYPAYTIVPIIVFAYVFSGMRNVVSLGMFLTKNTKYIAYITLFIAALNIGLNFIVIPYFGMIGAAYNTLFSFIIYYWLSLKISDRYYKIPFEHKKLFQILGVGIIFYFIAYLIPDINIIISITVKIIIICLFPIVLYYMKFYEVIELKSLRGFYNKYKNPMLWIQTINSAKEKNEE